MSTTYLVLALAEPYLHDAACICTSGLYNDTFTHIHSAKILTNVIRLLLHSTIINTYTPLFVVNAVPGAVGRWL